MSLTFFRRHNPTSSGGAALMMNLEEPMVLEVGSESSEIKSRVWVVARHVCPGAQKVRACHQTSRGEGDSPKTPVFHHLFCHLALVSFLRHDFFFSHIHVFWSWTHSLVDQEHFPYKHKGPISNFKHPYRSLECGVYL